MWSSAVVASLHYLALAIGLPAVLLRGRALKGPFDDAAFRRLFTADAMRHCATQKATEVCFDMKARKGIAFPEEIASKLRAIAA